jgi:hypothetical protein
VSGRRPLRDSLGRQPSMTGRDNKTATTSNKRPIRHNDKPRLPGNQFGSRADVVVQAR